MLSNIFINDKCENCGKHGGVILAGEAMHALKGENCPKILGEDPLHSMGVFRHNRDATTRILTVLPGRRPSEANRGRRLRWQRPLAKQPRRFPISVC
jgi:hypothetical protein